MRDARSLHGDVARARRLPGFSLSETSYAAGSRLRPHYHDSSYLCFVLQGTYTEACQQTSVVCGRDTLVVHPPGDRHANHFHSAVRCFNVVFDEAWRRRMDEAAIDRRLVVRDPHAAMLASRMYREFIDHDEVSHLIVEGAALEILAVSARADRATSDAPRWLRQAREFLHDRFTEEVTLSSVAAAVGVHEAHLARQFRRYYDRTPGEYVVNLRIEFARRALEETDMLLTDLAAAAGFCDQSHFTRRFKQAVGVPPGQYRRQRRRR